MKFHILSWPAGLLVLLVLNACAIFPTQTVSNTDVKVAVADVDVLADAAVTTIEPVGNADDERIICKRMMITGSRFKHKVCMTWFEWKDTDLRGKEYISDIQSVSTRVKNPQGS